MEAANMLRHLSKLFSQVKPAAAPIESAGNEGPTPLRDLLFDQAEKGYAREADENESLWRSLPVFAASFGFAVALLGYGLSNAPPPDRRGLTILIYILLLVAGGFFAWSFKWFWQVVGPRKYRYLPPDPELIAYGEGLRQFHLNAGAPPADAEQAAASEFKDYLTGEWSAAAGHNQQWNQSRAYARGRTVFHLMACFAVTLMANGIMLMAKKVDAVSAHEGIDDVQAPTENGAAAKQVGSSGQPAPAAAAAPIYRGGRDLALPQGPERVASVTDNKKQGGGSKSPPPQTTAQRPTPPQSRLVERSSVPADRRKD
jgi:hypothetical protein